MNWSRVLSVIPIAALALLPWTAQAATYYVTRGDDPMPNGCQVDDCSLREAVIATNATDISDLILLPDTAYNLSLVGAGDAASGDLDIVGSVTVRGSGASPAGIRAQHLMRIFEVPANAALNLDNLWLAGGEPASGEGSSGGCVYARNSTVTASRTTFDDCAAVAGGAINALEADLSLHQCTVSNNQAVNGGGVYVNGQSNPTTFSAVHVVFEGNQASVDGGALWLRGSAMESEVLGSEFNNNSAGSASFSRGGGIYVWSGGSGGNRLVLDFVQFAGNQAGQGGALAIGDADVDARRVTLEGNDASGSGGGVKIVTNGSLRFHESVAHDNHASEHGGGFATAGGSIEIVNASLVENSAGDGGGALHASAGASALFAHATLFDSGNNHHMVRIADAGTQVTWSNVILSGGCSVASAGPAFVSLGGNLEGPLDTCGLDHGSDLVNRSTAQLGLGSFELHVGPTLTYSITATSQARGHGVVAECSPLDQRFAPRGAGACDSGAYEYGTFANSYLFADDFDG